MLVAGQGVLADALARRLPRMGLEMQRASTSESVQRACVVAPDLLVLVGDAAADGGKRVLARLLEDESAALLPVLVICGPSLFARNGIAPRSSVAALAPEGGIDVCALRIQRLIESFAEHGLGGRPLQQAVDAAAVAATPAGAAAPAAARVDRARQPEPRTAERPRRSQTLHGVPAVVIATAPAAPAVPASAVAVAPASALAVAPAPAVAVAPPAPALAVAPPVPAVAASPVPPKRAATLLQLPPAVAPEPAVAVAPVPAVAAPPVPPKRAATLLQLPPAVAPAPPMAAPRVPMPAAPDVPVAAAPDVPVAAAPDVSVAAAPDVPVAAAPEPPILGVTLRPPRAKPLSRRRRAAAHPRPEAALSPEPPPPSEALAPPAIDVQWSDPPARDAHTPLAWTKLADVVRPSGGAATGVLHALQRRLVLVAAAVASVAAAIVLAVALRGAPPARGAHAAAAAHGKLRAPQTAAIAASAAAIATPQPNVDTGARAARDQPDVGEVDARTRRRAELAHKAALANSSVAQGHRLLRSGRLKPAEAAYLKALGVMPSYPRALAGLARVHLQRKDGAEAVRWAERLVKQQPNRGNNQLLLGDALAMRGQHLRARAAWQRAAAYGNATARKRLK